MDGAAISTDSHDHDSFRSCFGLLPLGLATAFMIPGLLGFSWLLGGRWIYHSPTNHPRISEGERWEDLKPPSVGREQQKRLPINVIDECGGKEHSADPPA